MTRHVTVEMEVDNVGKMDKTGAKCVLKGEASVDSVPIKATLTLTCDDLDVFEGMGTDKRTMKIEMILQDSSQHTLGE